MLRARSWRAADEHGAEAAALGLAVRAEDAARGAALGAVQVALQRLRVTHPDGADGAAGPRPVAEAVDVGAEAGAEGAEVLERLVWGGGGQLPEHAEAPWA